MQISEKSVRDSINYIIATCRRGSSDCRSQAIVDDYYYHTRSQLQGLRVLFVDCSRVLPLLDAAMQETHAIRRDSKARFSIEFQKLDSGDACRHPVQSPDVVGQGGN